MNQTFECPQCGCRTLVCTNCGAKSEQNVVPTETRANIWSLLPALLRPYIARLNHSRAEPVGVHCGAISDIDSGNKKF